MLFDRRPPNEHDPPTPLWWAGARVAAVLMLGAVPAAGAYVWRLGVPEESRGWLTVACGGVLLLAIATGVGHEAARRRFGRAAADGTTAAFLTAVLLGLLLWARWLMQ